METEPAAEAALAAARIFSASLARIKRTRMVKLATRRCSRGAKATEPATISTSSGLENQGELFPRLRNSSDTRSLDCATPCNVTLWLS